MNLSKAIIDCIKANPYCSFDEIKSTLEQQDIPGYPVWIVLKSLVGKRKVIATNDNIAAYQADTFYIVEKNVA